MTYELMNVNFGLVFVVVDDVSNFYHFPQLLLKIR